MKNRKTAKNFVVAMLLISICLSSVVSVFASSGTASESTESETITTKYGTVPTEYQDKTFVAFSEGVCIGASDVFNGKQSAESIITLALGTKYTKAGKNVEIVMLKDYVAPSEYHDNLAQAQATITLDLNGNTFYAHNHMFRLTPKSNDYNTTINLINGNIVLKNTPILRTGSYANPAKIFTVNFENVNFSFAEGSDVTSMVVGYTKGADVVSNYEFNFKNCVFDVRKAANHVTLFEANDPVDKYPTPANMTYTVEDCRVIANSPDSYTVWGVFNENSTYTEKNLSREVQISIYEEDFDSVEGKVEIREGNNIFGEAKGWIFAKKSTTGEAYIENGRLYFSGSKYDVIYRDGGETWGNYTVEADLCYTDENEGWGGLLYNVQSGTKFQKAGITLAKKYSLNGYSNGKWVNDKSGVNKGFTLDESVDLRNGTPFRIKVTVYNKSASMYYAMLNEDGSMQTNYIHLLTINNIPADAQTGSIGFMLSKDDHNSMWIDNIKCYSETLVSYSENFDSYGDLTLTEDANNSSIGVYFEKSDSLASGGAEIKDGVLHLSGGGKDFNAVFFNMGMNWTNYVLESDFTYVKEANNAGWGGLMFRATDIDNFWKGAINSGGSGSLVSQLNGSWYKNTNTSQDYSGGAIDYGETIRIRIVVNEKVAELYAAEYVDGKLGEWVHVMTTVSEDKFAEAHMTGTIGIIVGGSTNSKEKHIWVDNIEVSRIIGADRLAEAPNAAVIYEPETGIVNPPVVVEKLTDKLPSVDGERAAVVIVELDGSLNVIGENGEVVTSASEFIDTYRSSLIPAFVVDSVAEADALANLINEKTLIDCYVVAKAENSELVTRVRTAYNTTGKISGALIFDDLNSPEARQNARALVADSMSYVAISRAPLTEETAFYFAARQIAAWSYADSTAEVYRGIANGYHGIISEDVSVVYDVYESITETTVSGKTVVIAHRGANDNAEVPYPENTLMGIRAAKEIWGADAIEIDFGLTKDGYIVIMHDNTVDRTTNGTGNVSTLTLAEIKALTVDYVAGKETTVPTLEEVLLLAKELDVVLYCHAKDKTDANIAAFCYLVEKYDCADRVLLFQSSLQEFNSQTDRVYSGTAYELENHPVMIDGIVCTAGNQSILSSYATHVEGVIAMRECLNKYNYQPLFYPYSEQGDLWSAESFYYQLSARGFVNTHSVTKTQANMDSTALTGSGAVGWLTNTPQLCDDYHYAIDISGEKLTLTAGQYINLEKTLKLIVGNASANAGLVQIDGKPLTATANGYTLSEAGTVTVVYYATRTADGGATYRVYSEPVTLTFVSAPSFTPKTSITLSNALVYNVYVPASAELKSFTLDGVTYTDLTALEKNIATLSDGNDYYLFEIELPSAEAARNIILKAVVTVDGKDYNGSFTMSVPKYAKKVIETSTSEIEKTLVRDVLAYVKAAYIYFDAEDKTIVTDTINAILGDYSGAFEKVDGETDTANGLYGVVISLEEKPVIRFVLPVGVTTDGYTFKAGNTTLAYTTGTMTVGENTHYYAEVSFYAYQMIKEITYSNGVNSGSYHLNSYYDFVTTDNELKNDANLISLIEKLYNYCKSADAYRNYAICPHDYVDGKCANCGLEDPDKGTMSLSAPASIYSNYAGKDITANFTKTWYKGEVTYTTNHPNVFVENGKIFAKGTFLSAVDVTVTATTEHHTANATVKVSTFTGGVKAETKVQHYEETIIKEENKGGIIFVGDSYFDAAAEAPLYWKDFYEDFAGEKAFLMGIASAQIDDLEVVSERLVYPMEPSEIVVHIGFNDVHKGSLTVEELASRISALLTEYHNKLPNAKIYYMGVEPKKGGYSTSSGFYESSTVKAPALTKAMQEFAAANDWLAYVDTVDIFVGNDGQINTNMFVLTDKSHPTVDAYDLFRFALNEARGVANDTFKVVDAKGTGSGVVGDGYTITDANGNQLTAAIGDYVISGKFAITSIVNNAQIQFRFNDEKAFFFWDKDGNGLFTTDVDGTGAEAYGASYGSIIADWAVVVLGNKAYFYINGNLECELDVADAQYFNIGAMNMDVTIYDVVLSVKAENEAVYNENMLKYNSERFYIHMLGESDGVHDSGKTYTIEGDYVVTGTLEMYNMALSNAYIQFRFNSNYRFLLWDKDKDGFFGAGYTEAGTNVSDETVADEYFAKAGIITLDWAIVVKDGSAYFYLNGVLKKTFTGTTYETLCIGAAQMNVLFYNIEIYTVADNPEAYNKAVANYLK